MRFIAAIALLCAFFVTPAEARHHYRHHHAHHRSVTAPSHKHHYVAHHPKYHRYHRKSHFAVAAHTTPQSGVVAHPEGCPRTAFCGCGAAVHIFGKPIRHLWLAANWFSFPRAAPAPGMAAVRRHHVFVLEHQVRGDQWLTYDANSGRHLTRVHVRSIAGYTIVNPHSG
jgi:hypothetical protein